MNIKYIATQDNKSIISNMSFKKNDIISVFFILECFEKDYDTNLFFTFKGKKHLDKATYSEDFLTNFKKLEPNEYRDYLTNKILEDENIS